MIQITRLSSGAILIQQDATEIVIDAPAVALSLGPILVTLIDAGKIIGQARRDSYEAGLIVGYQNGVRETEARLAREAEQYEGLALLHASAPLAA